MRSITPMRTAKIGYVAISALLGIFGILLIFIPEISLKVLETVIGISMIVFAVIKLVGYFSKDLFRLAFQYDLAFGILLFILGIVVLISKEKALAHLCVAIGIVVLADGLFKIQIAVDSKVFGIGKWWMILLTAVLTGLIGLVLIFRPVETAVILMRLLGVTLLLEGLMNLTTVLSTVKIVRHQKPDVIVCLESKEIRK